MDGGGEDGVSPAALCLTRAPGRSALCGDNSSVLRLSRRGRGGCSLPVLLLTSHRILFRSDGTLPTGPQEHPACSLRGLCMKGVREEGLEWGVPTVVSGPSPVSRFSLRRDAFLIHPCNNSGSVTILILKMRKLPWLVCLIGWSIIPGRFNPQLGLMWEVA